MILQCYSLLFSVSRINSHVKDSFSFFLKISFVPAKSTLNKVFGVFPVRVCQIFSDCFYTNIRLGLDPFMYEHRCTRTLLSRPQAKLYHKNFAESVNIETCFCEVVSCTNCGLWWSLSINFTGTQVYGDTSVLNPQLRAVHHKNSLSIGPTLVLNSCYSGGKNNKLLPKTFMKRQREKFIKKKWKDWL